MVDPAQIDALCEQILDNVRLGRSPEEAARRLSLFTAQSLIDAALKLYREKASRVWTMREPASIQQENFEPWYLGPLAEDRFWPAYKDYLLTQRAWNEKDVVALDGASTKAVALLPPPGAGVVSARGLVVGYVQSGKTAHFTAVISKAADVGYRLFLVLSGITDSLRNQTQERLDREIVDLNLEHWFKLTRYGEDFREHSNANAILTSQSHLRIVGVIKKNGTRLRKLRDWLRAARPEVLRDCPILVIDDEADQASPNSAKDPERRTRINQLLVELLEILPKVAYVGYTATPFANVFIDPSSPRDLYPRDFIMYLPQPADYFGPERLFGRDPNNWDAADHGADGLDMIRVVPDLEVDMLRPSSDDGPFEPSITASLSAALRYFWMASAARIVRGQSNEHSTFLLHTSQSIQIHQSFAAPLEEFRSSFLEGVRSKNKDLVKQLRVQWNEESSKVPASLAGTTPVSFDDVLPLLSGVVERTEIKIENSRSLDRIDYRTPGRIYVVIGGNVLARGLTLEGLTVSYFLRTASAYDTLLQMGRWFGYRRGYEDLPRVWMTQELKSYFYDLATVEKEIRHDIDRYQDRRFTPLDFGVRVRTHPQLAITSRLKMQHAVRAAMTYAGTSNQTTVFHHHDDKWLERNFNAARDLIRTLRAEGIDEENIQGRPFPFYRAARSERIVEFLGKYQIHEDLENMKSGLLQHYIRLENSKGRLKRWNVGVVTREENAYGTIDLGTRSPVPLISRAAFVRERTGDSVDIKALMSAIDDGLDLDIPREQLQQRRKELRDLRDQQISDTGLLLLYPIYRNSEPFAKSDERRKPLNAVADVIGLALIFPDPKADFAELEYMTADLSGIRREEPEFTDEEQVA